MCCILEEVPQLISCLNVYRKLLSKPQSLSLIWVHHYLKIIIGQRTPMLDDKKKISFRNLPAVLLNCEKNEHCLSLGRISWVWLIYSKVVEYTMQGWSHGGRRLQNGITTSEVVLPWFNPPPLQPNAEYQCSKSPASWRSLPIWLPILICNPHYGEIP